jgi:hypothetical protein
MAAPISLESLPAELLSYIIVLMEPEEYETNPFPACAISKTSKTLRQVAFSTTELWRRLHSTCKIFNSYDNGAFIERWYIQYLSWWRKKVGNKFALTFFVHFEGAISDKTWIPLDGPAAQDIIALLACALEIETKSTSVEFILSTLPPGTITPFRALERMVVHKAYHKGDGGGVYDIWPSCRFPALRKFKLNGVRCHHLSKDPWGHLTHLDIAFYTTLANWKTLIGGLPALERGRIHLTLTEDTSDERSMSEDDLTLPNLIELTVEINDHFEPYPAANVLDGIHLPGLKNLRICTAQLTFECLYRLLQATPQLERIRLSSIFPAVNKRIKFRTITRDRLVDYAPHLRQIAIDIPNLRVFDGGPMQDYIDGLVQWKGEEVDLELPWLVGCISEPPIEAVRDYVASRGITDVTLRQRYRSEDVDVWHCIGT